MTVLLAGAPNVGKSTVFNALTGMNQHTGNWSGKTVETSRGYFTAEKKKIRLIDLPGTYSLLARSKEEEVACETLDRFKSDLCVVVCDATTLEKCLCLVLQIMQKTQNVIVCVNLIDRAKKKNISIDAKKLSRTLGVPVVATDAKSKKGLDELKSEILKFKNESGKAMTFSFDTQIETAIKTVCAAKTKPDRFFALSLLCKEQGKAFKPDPELEENLAQAKSLLEKKGIFQDDVLKNVCEATAKKASEIYSLCADTRKRSDLSDRRLDAVFTGKYTAVPVMAALFAFIFFLTVYAANYPSELLSKALFSLGDFLGGALLKIGCSSVVVSMLIDGIYTVMAWVVSVMLPPMAIFFPLFTLLEDFGYLPRMAFNLDCLFKKCNACGKQSLCMAMGLGCNAVGVTGCRIIDSPRERLIAILTNSLVPCNGRFPTIIAVISMFFVGTLGKAAKSLATSGILLCVIVLSVLATLAASFLLSKTVLKGQPSAFAIELPPYRGAKVLSVIVRSVFDRTLFVLARAVCVSAPMGLVIWCLANFKISGTPVIAHLSGALEPLGKLMGLDGVLLLAFVLGFPANEIVLPVALMCYSNQAVLSTVEESSAIFEILFQNGWTAVTGVCFILFSLFHFPCSTTLLTIKKETGSLKYTALSFALPTAIGFFACTAVNLISKLFV